ncbi:g532 [Coccomyxa viridis]|uniref:G532 protein n=1 Tax=Coccomyxa viridis TaxID=1274662 RepID=A0ABP1FG38_9CHLO
MSLNLQIRSSSSSLIAGPVTLRRPYASFSRRQSASQAVRQRHYAVRASTPTDDLKEKVSEAGSVFKSNVAQLLGVRGGERTSDIWKIRLQLTKPVTWVPLIWGVLCGAAASGNFTWTPEHVAQSLVCMTMSGPFLTGYTQTINDYYDREIDAINEPDRPIPSGAISETEVIVQFLALLAAGLGTAFALDKWVGHETPTLFYLAVFGSFISYIYSAPPLKLKQSGWAGNYALGSSYISLPWWAGQALFGNLTLDVIVLTMLYSTAGLGIAIVNDFKSIEGDRKMGLQSLPVAFGVDTAKWITVGTIDVTQFAVAAYLFLGLKEPIYGGILTALILPQVFFQYKYFIPDPIQNDVKYQASAQPFLVFGLLTTGLAIGHHNAVL